MNIQDKTTKQHELELWQQYRAGDKKALGKLVVSLNPLIQYQVERYARAPLPRTALEAEARRLAVRSFQDYNPDKAGLSTHVMNHMKHLQRYVANYQNVGRIPENRAITISRFSNIKSYLEESLNRPPTVIELADELQWSPAEVSRMERELRNDLSMTSATDDEFFDFDYNKTDEGIELVQFAYWDPTNSQEHKKYLEYRFGLNGGQKLDVKDIALKLNRSETYVRKLGAELGAKIARAQQV
jgi:DNA-directed RNA polymerase sigma subunit (sigma70/sigma32)